MVRPSPLVSSTCRSLGVSVVMAWPVLGSVRTTGLLLLGPVRCRHLPISAIAAVNSSMSGVRVPSVVVRRLISRGEYSGRTVSTLGEQQDSFSLGFARRGICRSQAPLVGGVGHADVDHLHLVGCAATSALRVFVSAPAAAICGRALPVVGPAVAEIASPRDHLRIAGLTLGVSG